MAQALLVALGFLRESLPWVVLSQHHCPACPACPDLSCGAQTCSGPAIVGGSTWSSLVLAFVGGAASAAGSIVLFLYLRWRRSSSSSPSTSSSSLALTPSIRPTSR
eukprot:6465045-Amphidinium_carterae.1